MISMPMHGEQERRTLEYGSGMQHAVVASSPCVEPPVYRRTGRASGFDGEVEQRIDLAFGGKKECIPPHTERFHT